jgi:hypothetical protein
MSFTIEFFRTRPSDEAHATLDRISVRRGEMVESDNRHIGQSFQLRRLEAPVAGKKHTSVVDDQRIKKAKLSYARRDLLDLMRAASG